MPAERSGQNMFDFQYGDDFGEHIDASTPTSPRCSSATTPTATRPTNAEQLAQAEVGSSDWLHSNDRKFLFELLVPAEHAQLESVGGDADRYDAELRPELMRRTIAAIQDFGIEVDIWKIEGVDERSDCEMLVEQARVGGRDGVVCVVLGRGADDAKVDQWLTAGRPRRGLRRLRDRALDLVGSAEGLRRRQDRALRGRAQHRRELPALRLRLRARRRRGTRRRDDDVGLASSRRRIVVPGKDAERVCSALSGHCAATEDAARGEESPS